MRSVSNLVTNSLHINSSDASHIEPKFRQQFSIDVHSTSTKTMRVIIRSLTLGVNANDTRLLNRRFPKFSSRLEGDTFSKANFSHALFSRYLGVRRCFTGNRLNRALHRQEAKCRKRRLPDTRHPNGCSEIKELQRISAELNRELVRESVRRPHPGRRHRERR